MTPVKHNAFHRLLMFFWASLLAWIFVQSSLAFASFDGDTPKTRKQANSLFKEARKMVVESKYKPALGRFQAILRYLDSSEASASAEKKEAWKKERLSLLFVIGRTYEYDQQWASAYKTYLSCLALQPKRKTKKLLQSRLRVIADKVLVTLSISSVPPASSVSIQDGEGKAHQGQTPLQIRLPPGETKLRLSHKDFQETSVTLHLEPSQALQVSYALLPLPPPPRRLEPPTSRPDLPPRRLEPPTSRPDLPPRREEPPTTQPLPPPLRRDIASQDLRSTSRPIPPPMSQPSPPAWLPPILWTTFALGLAGGLGGTGFFVAAHAEKGSFGEKYGQPSKCLAPATCTQEVLDHKARSETFQSAAIGVWVGSAVLLALAGGLLIWKLSFPPPTPPTPPDAATSSRPSASPLSSVPSASSAFFCKPNALSSSCLFRAGD